MGFCSHFGTSLPPPPLPLVFESVLQVLAKNALEPLAMFEIQCAYIAMNHRLENPSPAPAYSPALTY